MGGPLALVAPAHPMLDFLERDPGFVRLPELQQHASIPAKRFVAGQPFGHVRINWERFFVASQILKNARAKQGNAVPVRASDGLRSLAEHS